MPQHGGPEVLVAEQVERPAPAAGEVLIEMAAAGLNPVNAQVRAGSWVPDAMGRPPMILRWDVAGVIAEVGDGVTSLEPGDRVFGMPSFPELARCDAEYVIAPRSALRGHRPRWVTNRQVLCLSPGHRVAGARPGRRPGGRSRPGAGGRRWGGASRCANREGSRRACDRDGAPREARLSPRARRGRAGRLHRRPSRSGRFGGGRGDRADQREDEGLAARLGSCAAAAASW